MYGYDKARIEYEQKLYAPFDAEFDGTEEEEISAYEDAEEMSAYYSYGEEWEWRER
ncbi:hypothetical protein IJI31_01105 [bacterium]|nr:hypothetical protein [bacterium]